MIQLHEPGPVTGAVTPAELIARVRSARRTADAAEADLLLLAVEWAHAHPELSGDETWHAARPGGCPSASLRACDDGAPDPEDPGLDLDAAELEWFGIPGVRWDAPATFAVANGMSTSAGKAFLRDALVLHHRLPRVMQRVAEGQIPAWRARRVAQAVLSRPRDVVEYVDQVAAPVAGSIGLVGLDRLLDEAMVRLYPEQREAEQLEALDARHATLDERSLNHTGIAEMVLRGDWLDLTAFDQALSLVAAALVEQGSREPLDVRRSQAVGVLADPEAALALLGGRPRAGPSRSIVVHLHLSDRAVLGLDPVGTDEQDRVVLEQVVREWCGRDDSAVTIRPVIDLEPAPGEPHVHDAGAPTYEISEALREIVGDIARSCVFPWCHRPARRCDVDHTVPFTAGGPTCRCNLAPLCRHHHRLKTHAGWRYAIIEPGAYLWSEPHGQRLLRNRDGTVDVTPRDQGSCDWIPDSS